MTHITLEVQRPLLVVVRCRWCGRPWGCLSPGTMYRGIKCPQRRCGMELSGIVGVEWKEGRDALTSGP